MDARNCLVSLASACSSFPDLVDLRNADGDAAVHLAATFGRAAALRALLDQLGADPEAVVDREKKGRDEPLTPLEMAAFYGYPGEKREGERVVSFMKFMFEQSASPSCCGETRWTGIKGKSFKQLCKGF